MISDSYNVVSNVF